MSGSAAEIAAFIHGNTSEFWQQSPLHNTESANEIIFQAELWKEYSAKASSMEESLSEMATRTREEVAKNDYKTFDAAMRKEFGDNYDASGKYKEMFMQQYNNGEFKGDVTRVSAAVQNQYRTDADRAKREAAAAKYGVPFDSDGPYRYTRKDKT